MKLSHAFLQKLSSHADNADMENKYPNKGPDAVINKEPLLSWGHHVLESFGNKLMVFGKVTDIAGDSENEKRTKGEANRDD
jgi:hypothetical protein